MVNLTFSCGFLTFRTQSPPGNRSLTCDCTMCRVEADTLSASWQKEEAGGGEYACVRSSYTQAHAPHHHGNKHLLTEAGFFFFLFAFCFPPRPLGLASERCQMRNFILKWETQKQSLLLSEYDSYQYKTLMQNLNHSGPFRLKENRLMDNQAFPK